MKNSTSTVTLIDVHLDIQGRGKAPIPVGRLASQNKQIYFEYYPQFLKTKLNISPFKLPLRAGLQSFDPYLFEGLPGVFNDSLPDGWGRLLVDRSLGSQGIHLASVSVLDRLTQVGAKGMGALSYLPDHAVTDIDAPIDLDQLSSNAEEILRGNSQEIFEILLAMNGSSAGARPKALIGVNADKSHIMHGVCELPEQYEHWLVKFHNSVDRTDAGAIEYVYNQMATLAEIETMKIHLFPSNKNSGYFATKRFDRNHNKRLHTHTACGLLHSDFRTPSLDYLDLIRATQILTKDAREVLKMFRLAVFNVLSHNRDDHAKNFSFIMSELGVWKMAPAYDLTFSSGPKGEQSTMVMGEGKNPTVEHLLQLAKMVEIKKEEATKTISAVKCALSEWKTLALQAGISKNNIHGIQKNISEDRS